MDFLKDLQEALAMGLTKEQYIDVWKTDRLAKGLLSDRDCLPITRPQMENTETKATLVDHNGHPSSLDFQRVNEYNDHFLTNCRYMFNQLAENQEQQRKQFQQKHDQVMEEVRARFSLLSDHISNVADCNTNSLKVCVMQELGLFQQELQQMIHEGGIKQACAPEGNKLPTAVQGLMNSAGSQALSGSSSSLNSAKDNKNTHTVSVSKLPTGLQVFSVTLSEKNGGFLSPAMLSSGVPMKAKFRGRFDVEGRLNIFLHVRSSEYDGKWPLKLYSTGDVYHSASKRYTQVWQLLPTVFQKPDSADEEFTIKCVVSLTTSRGEYPNVTYKQLVSSHYIENNTLTMRCTLMASRDT